jgi:hypothetical protein
LHDVDHMKRLISRTASTARLLSRDQLRAVNGGDVARITVSVMISSPTSDVATADDGSSTGTKSGCDGAP